MMDVKVSKNKHINRWYDQDKMFDKIASKTMHKDEEGDRRGKRIKIISAVMSFKNCRVF